MIKEWCKVNLHNVRLRKWKSHPLPVYGCKSHPLALLGHPRLCLATPSKSGWAPEPPARRFPADLMWGHVVGGSPLMNWCHRVRELGDAGECQCGSSSCWGRAEFLNVVWLGEANIKVGNPEVAWVACVGSVFWFTFLVYCQNCVASFFYGTVFALERSGKRHPPTSTAAFLCRG